MAINESDQIIFAATQAADNISEIKAASFRTLLAYSAAFAYIIQDSEPYLSPLSLLFLLGSVLSIYLVGELYPKKIAERRARLAIAYGFMPVAKKIRDRALAKIFGASQTVDQKDVGDLLFQYGAVIYIVVLLNLYLAKATA